MSDETAKEYAKKIYDGVDWFGIEEDIVYATLEMCKSKAQILQVSDAYYNLSGITLMQLIDKMYDAHTLKAKQIINSKPDIY